MQGMALDAVHKVYFCFYFFVFIIRSVQGMALDAIYRGICLYFSFSGLGRAWPLSARDSTPPRKWHSTLYIRCILACVCYVYFFFGVGTGIGRCARGVFFLVRARTHTHK
jgi:hypothetical protein